MSVYSRKKNELSVEAECILWGICVVVPGKFRGKLLTELHRDHPGICKMKSIACSYLEKLAKGCVECFATQNFPPVLHLHLWSWPSRVFQQVHLDFAVPFQGAMFLVSYSKWPEILLMKDTTVNSTIEILRRMLIRYGLPEQVVSDNCSQFTLEEFAVFMTLNGIKHTHSAPYHPATNGLAERLVQTFKKSLKASLDSGLSLSHRLCNFLATYRTLVHIMTGVTPSSLFPQREMHTRLDLLKPVVNDALSLVSASSSPSQKSSENVGSTEWRYPR